MCNFNKFWFMIQIYFWFARFVLVAEEVQVLCCYRWWEISFPQAALSLWFNQIDKIFSATQETSPFCVWMVNRHCSKRINSWQMHQEDTSGVGDLSHCRQLPGPVQDGYGGSSLWSCWAMFPHFPLAFCLAAQLAPLPVPHSSSWSYWSL